RRQILKATVLFVHFEAAERSAELRAPAVKRIGEVRKAATQIKVLLGGPETDAEFYAKRLIRKHFQNRRLRKRKALDDLLGILTSLVDACILAARKINSPDDRGFRKGECWEKWICELTNIVKKHDLPTGVRKDSDKFAGDA